MIGPSQLSEIELYKPRLVEVNDRAYRESESR